MTHDCTPREVPMDPKWRETIMCLAKVVRKFEIEMSICDPTLILVLSVVHDSKSTKTKKFYYLPRASIWTNRNIQHGSHTNLEHATRNWEFHLNYTSKQHSKQNTMSKIWLQHWRMFWMQLLLMIRQRLIVVFIFSVVVLLVCNVSLQNVCNIRQ